MDPVVDYFIQEGVLGVLVAGLIGVVVYLYHKSESVRDKRIKDHMNYTRTVKEMMEARLAMQEHHTDHIMNTQKEVDKMVTHLTSTLEALIGALARGIEDND